VWQNIFYLENIFSNLFFCLPVQVFSYITSLFLFTFPVSLLLIYMQFLICLGCESGTDFFLFKVFFKPVMTITSCYRQQILALCSLIVMNLFLHSHPCSFSQSSHSCAPCWFENCEQCWSNVCGFTFLHSPLHTEITIIDKFIVTYISPSNVNTESEGNEPGQKRPTIMYQHCSDNHLSSGFSSVVMQHV
jgi:hypothetical protein